MWTALVVASFVLPFVSWPLRRAVYDRKLRRFEANVRHMRALATRDVRLRKLATPDATLDALDPQLRALDLRVLGDMIDDNSEQKLPARWFVDAAGTTFGMIGTIERRPYALLMSCTPDRIYATRMVAAARLATPPQITRLDLHVGTTIADLLAAHRALATGVELDRIADLDAVIREVERMRTLILTWREAQPPVQLLDADLRAILGARYDRLRPTLANRLRAPLPEARVL